MRTLRIVTVIVVAVAVAAGATPASADPPPGVPDQRYPLSSIFGAVRHNRGLGMCYLDHDTCPYPWMVGGNFDGFCVSPNPDFTHCEGTFEHLWFNFIVPGFGAEITFRPAPVLPPIRLDEAGPNDLIHAVRFQGVINLACSGMTCVTDFSGNTLYTDKWDCYVHYRTHSVDC